MYHRSEPFMILHGHTCICDWCDLIPYFIGILYVYSTMQEDRSKVFVLNIESCRNTWLNFLSKLERCEGMVGGRIHHIVRVTSIPRSYFGIAYL